MTRRGAAQAFFPTEKCSRQTSSVSFVFSPFTPAAPRVAKGER